MEKRLALWSQTQSESGRHDILFTSFLRKLEEQPPGEDEGLFYSRRAIRYHLNKWATATTTYGSPMYSILLPTSDGAQKNNVAVEVVESVGVPLPKLNYNTQRASNTQHTPHNTTHNATQHTRHIHTMQSTTTNTNKRSITNSNFITNSNVITTHRHTTHNNTDTHTTTNTHTNPHTHTHKHTHTNTMALQAATSH